MDVITALNPATIGGEPPLLEYIALAEKYGFGGIEFNIDRVVQLAQETSWNTVRNAFEQYGVAPAVFGLPVEWRKDDATFNDDLKNLSDYAKSAAEIGCTRTGTWLPPAIDGSFDDFSRLISKRFYAVARVLADYNIRLALEFVGPDTCRVGPTAMGPHPYIHTLGQTLDLIEILDVPGKNVGILLDSFHWYTSHSSIENLLMLTADQVVHVHINDAPDRPVNEQKDFERLLPGDGIINLKGFLQQLARIGYDGYVAVETFNKELSARGFEEAAQLTGASVDRLLSTL
jgi:sugar phosphate isomerase/epimerase